MKQSEKRIQLEEERKKKKEDGTKLPEEKEEEDKVTELNSQAFSKLDLKGVGENMKNCSKIFTLWKVNSKSYSKVKDLFLFKSYEYDIKIASDGETLILNQGNNVLILDKDLNELFKMEMKAYKDPDGNEKTDVNSF